MYVALIQTASALPFFLLALPAGSIGDIVDRRKLILSTEIWMFAIAAVLTVVTFTGTMTPWLLLLLTLALSLGDAIEAPTWRAIFPELVHKNDLTPALALNGIEFNLARATGPGLAGLVIAVAGVATAFSIGRAVISGCDFCYFRVETSREKSKLPVETLSEASWAAIRYVRYSPEIRTLLLRSGTVIFFRKFVLGSATDSRKAAKQKRSWIRPSIGVFWCRRSTRSYCFAALQIKAFDRDCNFNGYGCIRWQFC